MNGLYNEQIKKNWRTREGLVKDIGESWKPGGVHYQCIKTPLRRPSSEGPIMNVVGNHETQSSNSPQFKTTLQGFEKVVSFISFWFARRDQWSYESKVARLTLMEWYRAVVCSDTLSWCFQLSQPWQLRSLRKFTSLQDCVNSSEGTRQWLQKSLPAMNKKRCYVLSLPLWIDHGT